MNKIFFFTFFIFLNIFLFSCGSENKKEKENSNAIKKIKESSGKSDKIAVYYFHFSRRCMTCYAVENETKNILETLFSEDFKKSKISFLSINLEEEKNKELAKKFQVSSQSLIFTKGNKKVDLTNKAFMYAVDNSDKLKEKIKSTIEELKKF